MKKIVNFEIIIIGSNHINTLGVLRSFGENGIKSNVIITGNNINCYTLKSKYIKQKWIIEEDEQSLIKLLNELHFSCKKIYIIPTSDFAAYVLDKNFYLLSKKYFLPNIDNTQGKIIEYMDKNTQYKVAHNKIEMANTMELDLNNIFDENELIDYIPCILKPVISAGNQKSDIVICKSMIEFDNNIKSFKKKGYKRILIQKFIEYDYECDISGISDGKNTYLSNIINKINIYPAKRGSTSCGKVVSSKSIDMKPIINIINKIKYNGIFDVEIFIKNNIFYLNEINFRNSAVSYGLSKEKNYIPYSWVLLNEGERINISKHKKDYIFVVEDFEFKSLLNKEIKLKDYLFHMIFSKKKIYFSIHDIKPYFYKFIYMIKKGKQK